MPSPNQITTCAFSSLQGIYVPCVRMYDAEPHPNYGLLRRDYYIKARVRNRADAIKLAKEVVKQIKLLSADDQREYLKANLSTSRL